MTRNVNGDTVNGDTGKYGDTVNGDAGKDMCGLYRWKTEGERKTEDRKHNLVKRDCCRTEKSL